MRKCSNAETDVKKMYLYSAHDHTVAALLNTMGVFNQIPPPYASAVIWELHQYKDSHFVRVSTTVILLLYYMVFNKK